MDVLDLARLQFAITTNLHFVFVALTLGLVPMVAIMQTRHTFTGRDRDELSTRFWGQIYLINYALGIVTGLVLEFQFGMNWSGLSHFAGDVFGAPLAIETVSAFFLESTFLGLWIFGWHILPKWVHLALIWLVALTAYVSAFWILTANSYLQNPVGSRVVDGRLLLDDFGLLITNPHMLTALPHVTGAAFMTASWLVIAVSALHLRRGHQVEFFTSCLRWGVLVAAGSGLLTLISGHVAPAHVEATQPDKLEGPMEPFLNSMLLIGDVLAVLALLVLLPMLLRNTLARARWFHPVLIALAPLPVVASALGWIVREMGRQPWLVYEHLTVAEGLSPHVSAPMVMVSLVVFTLVLGSLTLTNIVLILKAAARGPGDVLLGSKPVEPEPPSPVSISGEST